MQVVMPSVLGIWNSLPTLQLTVSCLVLWWHRSCVAAAQRGALPGR